MAQQIDTVLVLGSGPNAPECAGWPRGGLDRIVAINNAWRVRADWDDLIYPEDFPAARRPLALQPGQRLIEADEFVPVQNDYGGFVYAGGTMAFTAGYWALGALRPRVLAFMGCDMVYPASGATHFYGSGTADPLRPDVTLQDLGAKSARLALIAARQGCACVNLSSAPASALLFPRIAPGLARSAAPAVAAAGRIEQIEAREAALGYFVPSGRYWEEAAGFDAAALSEIDNLWRAEWQGLQTAAAAGRSAA